MRKRIQDKEAPNNDKDRKKRSHSPSGSNPPERTDRRKASAKGTSSPFKKDEFKPVPGGKFKKEAGFKPKPPRPFDKKPSGYGYKNEDKKMESSGPGTSRPFDRKLSAGKSGNPYPKTGTRTDAFRKPGEFQIKNTSKPETRPAFFKGNTREENPESAPRDPKRQKLSENRQTGLAFAPKYDENRMKKQLPPKILKKVATKEPKDDTVRLNRYIANAGLCSRREADEFISSGQITVNGKIVTEMGYKVQPGDVVKYGRKILNREKLVYVLLNKPKDFITTTEDPEDRKTVMELVAQACEERIYPVGRLDRMTTGLLLLTNDGELADKLSHPSNGIRKVYQVELNKPITQEHFDSILAGIELEDGNVKADELGIVTPDGEVVGIEIHSGKNRIVRRIFEHLGYEVLKLDRTTYAGLTKKDLPRGKWRFLSEKEVIRLKYMI